MLEFIWPMEEMLGLCPSNRNLVPDSPRLEKLVKVLSGDVLGGRHKFNIQETGLKHLYNQEDQISYSASDLADTLREMKKADVNAYRIKQTGLLYSIFSEVISCSETDKKTGKRARKIVNGYDRHIFPISPQELFPGTRFICYACGDNIFLTV